MTKKARKKAAASPKKKSAPARKKTRNSAGASGLLARIKDGVESVSQQIEGAFSAAPSDIVDALKQDHKALRDHLAVLKDTSKDLGERKRAYASFAVLLKSHSSAEEKVVYARTLHVPRTDLPVKTAEGYVEHQLANDLMAQMSRAKDALTWSAHANVLAEIVEHHLKEEERDVLGAVRRNVPSEVRDEMLVEFLALRKKTQTRKTAKNAGVLKAAKAN